MGEPIEREPERWKADPEALAEIKRRGRAVMLRDLAARRAREAARDGQPPAPPEPRGSQAP